MKVDINKISGKSSGKKITLSDKIFSIKPNNHAIYLDVKSFLANILLETLVSSTAINCTSDKTSNALIDISAKLPIGVPMIYKAPSTILKFY